MKVELIYRCDYNGVSSFTSLFCYLITLFNSVVLAISVKPKRQTVLLHKYLSLKLCEIKAFKSYENFIVCYRLQNSRIFCVGLSNNVAVNKHSGTKCEHSLCVGNDIAI